MRQWGVISLQNALYGGPDGPVGCDAQMPSMFYCLDMQTKAKNIHSKEYFYYAIPTVCGALNLTALPPTVNTYTSSMCVSICKSKRKTYKCVLSIPSLKKRGCHD